MELEGFSHVTEMLERLADQVPAVEELCREARSAAERERQQAEQLSREARQALEQAGQEREEAAKALSAAEQELDAARKERRKAEKLRKEYEDGLGRVTAALEKVEALQARLAAAQETMEQEVRQKALQNALDALKARMEAFDPTFTGTISELVQRFGTPILVDRANWFNDYCALISRLTEDGVEGEIYLKGRVQAEKTLYSTSDFRVYTGSYQRTLLEQAVRDSFEGKPWRRIYPSERNEAALNAYIPMTHENGQRFSELSEFDDFDELPF